MEAESAITERDSHYSGIESDQVACLFISRFWKVIVSISEIRSGAEGRDGMGRGQPRDFLRDNDMAFRLEERVSWIPIYPKCQSMEADMSYIVRNATVS